ncbi:FusB/FusC family EF-G-binding protein [Paenisporosarcina cavernae]|uniref:Elongation factor G-binding protein n=1 Tax=Paenisporosarcina cavernae TaxID=2320858 RepID=A0A385YW03_9BACL|nr:FusB/FusC family EF-G-binding protein [Paenisporosarcina cavernae]AYC30470.1 elongation factor G-binding protein [Paenisporosarcina cavernae]
MEAFLSSDQFHFLTDQVKILVNASGVSKDKNVLAALLSVREESVRNLLPDLSEEQQDMLNSIQHVTDKQSGEQFLAKLQPFVIPFPALTDEKIRKLFPKLKKVSIPNLTEIDWRLQTFLGWNDKGSDKKCLIFWQNEKHLPTYGTFEVSKKDGICAICHKHDKLGLFTAAVKGNANGAYTKRGNYICQDSLKCSQQVIDSERMTDFIEIVRAR